jgi:hypothetical protein
MTEILCFEKKLLEELLGIRPEEWEGPDGIPNAQYLLTNFFIVKLLIFTAGAMICCSLIMKMKEFNTWLKTSEN